MKYAVISDLHANLAALELVLKDAASCGAQKVVCLGDIVGYGPLPAETFRLIQKTASVIVAGNHDDAVSGRMDPSDFIDLASDAVHRHRDLLSKDELKALRLLPYTAKIEGAELSHGDFTEPQEFNYIDSDEAACANFAASDAQLLFVGHTHTPCMYITGASGRVYQLEAQDFVLEEGKRYIVNTGSVGYPRESNEKCLSSYVIYDSTNKTVSFRFLPFSVSSVMQRGKNRKASRLLPLTIVSLVCVLGGALFFLGRNKAPAPQPTIAVAEKTPIDERSITLPPSAKEVRANLRLENKSYPAQVEFVFLTASGDKIRSESKHVKEGYRAAIEIPQGAVSVKFKVFEASTGKAPRIKSFLPAAK